VLRIARKPGPAKLFAFGYRLARPGTRTLDPRHTQKGIWLLLLCEQVGDQTIGSLMSLMGGQPPFPTQRAPGALRSGTEGSRPAGIAIAMPRWAKGLLLWGGPQTARWPWLPQERPKGLAVIVHDSTGRITWPPSGYRWAVSTSR